MASEYGAAIVTGGTGGIGGASVLELIHHGYKKFILGYRQNEEHLRVFKEKLSGYADLQVEFVAGDFESKETTEKYFQVLEAKFEGHLSAIVHAAGLYLEDKDPGSKSELDSKLEMCDRYQTIYGKTFMTLVELGRKHFKNGGRIVAVSSPGCNLNYTPRLQYLAPGTGKASMEYLARHYALVLGPENITCNTVIPGYTRTYAFADTLAKNPGMETHINAKIKTVPIQRWAQPSDIGGVIGFLCSDKAGFVTGVTIPVDGGLHFLQ